MGALRSESCVLICLLAHLITLSLDGLSVYKTWASPLFAFQDRAEINFTLQL